ncbi:MAG: P1 family peptidase [Chloroflexota bacterium]|nr:P1 family peptidase [Chloroflexota bacterium]
MNSNINEIKIGHWTDNKNKTGCTAIISELPLVASIDVRGGAPGTKEIALLDPIATAPNINGILLTGGSAFGLNASSGVVKYLEEKDIGIKFGGNTIPLVPSAVIFDLNVGDSKVRPDVQEGYLAAKNASNTFEIGKVGVGTGCTVGKLLGSKHSMQGGLGFSSHTFDDGTSISCLVAVNALGSIVNPENGNIIAGPKRDGKIFDSLDLYINGKPEKRGFQNTTIGTIITNAKINKVDCKRLAIAAHDGLALSVRPSHTSNDGDLFFAVTTNQKDTKVTIDQLFAASIKVTYQAIINAIDESN